MIIIFIIEVHDNLEKEVLYLKMEIILCHEKMIFTILSFAVFLLCTNLQI